MRTFVTLDGRKRDANSARQSGEPSRVFKREIRKVTLASRRGGRGGSMVAANCESC